MLLILLVVAVALGFYALGWLHGRSDEAQARGRAER